jgi:hypothetical protein
MCWWTAASRTTPDRDGLPPSPKLIGRVAQAPRAFLAGGASKRPPVRKPMHRNARQGVRKRARPTQRDHPTPQTTKGPTPELEPVAFWRSMRLRETGFSSQRSLAAGQNSAYDVHGVSRLLDRGRPPELAARIMAPTEREPRSLLTSPSSPSNRADLAGSSSVFARKMSAPGAPRSTSWLSGSRRPAEPSTSPSRTPGRKPRAALAAPELGVGGTQLVAS